MSTARQFVRMFKPQFAAAVKAGTKRQTVRPVPKRMPAAGDWISLRTWSGAPYRSRQMVLGESVIERVARCSIDVAGLVTIDGEPAADGFALADGFRSHRELVEWFRAQHGLPFEGVVIFWLPPL